MLLKFYSSAEVNKILYPIYAKAVAKLFFIISGTIIYRTSSRIVDELLMSKMLNVDCMPTCAFNSNLVVAEERNRLAKHMLVPFLYLSIASLPLPSSICTYLLAKTSFSLFINLMLSFYICSGCETSWCNYVYIQCFTAVGKNLIIVEVVLVYFLFSSRAEKICRV